MCRLSMLLLAVVAGCQAVPRCVPCAVETRVAAVAPARPTAFPNGVWERIVPGSGSLPIPPCLPGPPDLPTLWNLALANNPTLREAAAGVEAARGQAIQARKYPNPRFTYMHDSLGNNVSPLGTISFQLSQEIVTGGKRRLDGAIAARGTDVAALALLGTKYDVLTRIRQAYYDYQTLWQILRVNGEVVAALHAGVQVTRQQVEIARTRPRADLLRLEALLEEARIGQARGRTAVEAAWRQLAAEVGLPQLPLPDVPVDWAAAEPHWDQDAVARRVLAVNTQLKQAAVQVEQARLQVERARAEAIPNVTVGGGWDRESVDQVSGAIISVETALPLWDRKQGRIYEARARWLRAQATAQALATRLLHDTAEAFGRYQAARQQAQRLAAEVLPRLRESLDLVRRGLAGGAAGTTFADVLLAQQSLNETRVRLAETQRNLWKAVADLQGLMQLDLDESTDQLATESTDLPKRR